MLKEQSEQVKESEKRVKQFLRQTRTKGINNMTATKITFKPHESVERAFAEIRVHLLTIGADLIDCSSSHVLAARGLIELVARSLKDAAAVDLLAVEVKARQIELQATLASSQDNPCHCPTKCPTCVCGHRDAASEGVGTLALKVLGKQ